MNAVAPEDAPPTQRRAWLPSPCWGGPTALDTHMLARINSRKRPKKTLRDPLILPYEINKTKPFLNRRLALEEVCKVAHFELEY